MNPSHSGRRLNTGRVAIAALSLACTAALAAAVASARSAPRLETHRQGGDVAKLTWGLGLGVGGLNEATHLDFASLKVLAIGCEALQFFSQDGRLQPGLALSVSQPNQLTYVYHLRSGVKFWDGSVLTPADVVYSIQQLANPTSQMAAYFTALKSATAVGASEVKFQLKRADPFFRYTIAESFVVQKAFWAAHQSSLGNPGVLTMCTGPYQFTSFSPSEIDAKAVDGYWGKRPAVRSVALKVITSPSDLYLAMKSGQIDGSFDVPQQQIGQWQQLSIGKVTLAPKLDAGFFAFNVSKPPFNDVHVRRAFSYALDKAGIVKAVLGGYGKAASTMPPPEQWSNLLGAGAVAKFYASLPQYSYSLAKARAELKQSKSPNGFTVGVVYPNDKPELGKVELILAASLKKIGVTLTVKQVTRVVWGDQFGHPARSQLIVGDWGVTYPDPADALHFIYPSAKADPSAYNLSEYASPEMDKLIAQQNTATSTKARVAAIEAALKLGATDQPYLPFWWAQIALDLNSKLSWPTFGPWYFYGSWVSGIQSAG